MTVHKQRRNSVGRWVAGFVVVLMAGLLGSAASGSRAQATGTGSGSNSALAAVDCGTGTYNRGLTDAIGDLQRKAKNQYPDTFGQVSVTSRNPEDGIFVSFSEDAEGKVAQLAEDFPCPDLLVAKNINYSAKEVVAFARRIGVDRSRAKRGLAPLGHATIGYWGFGALIDEAVFDIAMPLVTKRIRAAFRSEYRAKDVRVKVARKPVRPPYPFLNDGYRGMTVLLLETGYPGDDIETGQDWGARLKKLNRYLRQTKKRLELVEGKGFHQQAQKLKRRVAKMRLRKQILRRKMLGLPWPIQSVRR